MSMELSTSFIVVDTELFTKRRNLEIVRETSSKSVNGLARCLGGNKYDSANYHKSSSQ